MFVRSLKTTFTAGLLATTLALTAVTPNSAAARMSDEEIAGLLGLLAFGAIIHNRRNNDVTPTPAPQPQPSVNRGWRVLPVDCVRNVTRRNGNTIRMFGQRCLNNNYNHPNRLPEACHVRVRNENGQRRQGYRVRCMRDHGFRTNRR
ncbi:MAG TPA: hypothetical protein DIT67_09190 [Octadecabacter sp.]|nr:hypothetical protein [Octadecabacter sp.]